MSALLIVCVSVLWVLLWNGSSNVLVVPSSVAEFIKIFNMICTCMYWWKLGRSICRDGILLSSLLLWGFEQRDRMPCLLIVRRREFRNWQSLLRSYCIASHWDRSLKSILQPKTVSRVTVTASWAQVNVSLHGCTLLVSGSSRGTEDFRGEAGPAPASLLTYKLCKIPPWWKHRMGWGTDGFS